MFWSPQVAPADVLHTQGEPGGVRHFCRPGRALQKWANQRRIVNPKPQAMPGEGPRSDAGGRLQQLQKTRAGLLTHAGVGGPEVEERRVEVQRVDPHAVRPRAPRQHRRKIGPILALRLQENLDEGKAQLSGKIERVFREGVGIKTGGGEADLLSVHRRAPVPA